jgi:hypothetical protein
LFRYQGSIEADSAAGETEVQSLRQRIDFLESLLRDSRTQSVSAYFGGAAGGSTTEESASGSSPDVMQSPSSYAQLASSQRREESDLIIQESYDYHILKRDEPAQQNRADSDSDDDDPGLSSAVTLASPFPFALSSGETRRSQFEAVLALAPNKSRSDYLVDSYVRWIAT